MQTGYAVIPYRLAMQAGYSVCFIKTGYADRPCKQSALKSVLQAQQAGYAFRSGRHFVKNVYAVGCFNKVNVCKLFRQA